MPRAIILLIALLTSSAFDQQIVPVHDYALVVMTKKPDGTEWQSFSLKPTGCLVGPLEFTDLDGTASFKLDDGIDFPSGCSRHLPSPVKQEERE